MARPNSDFQFSEGFEVNDEVKKAFDENGYVIIRNLMNSAELGKLKEALEHEDGVMKHTYTRSDGEGRRAKVVLWNQPGNDLTGVVARTHKMAGTFEKLLGGEVYHYHSKVICKEAKTGGAHIWHQDYGYWYENGCILPNMGTAWLAVDKADRTNGCLKILVGSHKLGRVDHIRVGDQAGADTERVAQAHKFCELLYVEINPGDCLFFHCNVLHRSDKNDSEKRRWAFLVSYNRADNNPVYEHHHPQYTPLTQVSDSAIMECNNITDMRGKDFWSAAGEEKGIKTITDKTH